MRLLQMIMGSGRLIRGLDATALDEHERAVQRLASMGGSVVPRILRELSQEPDKERSPSVVVAQQGGSVDHVIANSVYAGSPAPADMPPERVLKVPVASRLIAIGKNRQYGLCLALGHIGDERAVPALTARLSDTNSHVVSAAAEALIRIGTDAGLLAVLPCIRKDSDLSWHLNVMVHADKLLEWRNSDAARDVLAALKEH